MYFYGFQNFRGKGTILIGGSILDGFFYAHLMQENPDLESQNHHFYLGSMFLRVFEGNWS